MNADDPPLEVEDGPARVPLRQHAAGPKERLGQRPATVPKRTGAGRVRCSHAAGPSRCTGARLRCGRPRTERKRALAHELQHRKVMARETPEDARLPGSSRRQGDPGSTRLLVSTCAAVTNDPPASRSTPVPPSRRTRPPSQRPRGVRRIAPDPPTPRGPTASHPDRQGNTYHPDSERGTHAPLDARLAARFKTTNGDAQTLRGRSTTGHLKTPPENGLHHPGRQSGGTPGGRPKALCAGHPPPGTTVLCRAPDESSSNADRGREASPQSRRPNWRRTLEFRHRTARRRTAGHAARTTGFRAGFIPRASRTRRTPVRTRSADERRRFDARSNGVEHPV